MKPVGLRNGSPGDSQIHKKHEIGSSGRGPEKNVELNSKSEALDLRNLCFYIGEVTKSLFPPISRNLTKCFPNRHKNCTKSNKPKSGGLLENTTKTNAENNAIWTQNRPGGGAHERGFRIPMLLKTTFYLHASSFFDMSNIFAFFLTFCEHLEIAVLPAWELTFREM